MKSSASSAKPSARSARNGAPRARLTTLDACGPRYQHHRVRPDRPAGKPAAIIDAWLDGRFTLLICAAQVDELRATLQKPPVAELFNPHKAGRVVNQVKKLAEDIDALPPVKPSPDPADDFLLALSEAGKAHYLVIGAKSGLLALGCHKGRRIVSARDFAALVAPTN